MAPIGVLAPVFYGWVFDTSGSYNTAFLTALILAVLATATTLFIGSPGQFRNTA
jgi:cyanate permease